VAKPPSPVLSSKNSYMLEGRRERRKGRKAGEERKKDK
jgi:hypothetical protein